VEQDGDSIFLKARARSYPIAAGPVSLGVYGQHIDGSNFPAKQEAGPTIQFKGAPWEGSFGKLNIHFDVLGSNNIDWYGFLNSGDVSADILGVYNSEKRTLMLRPGVDVKLDDNLKVGLEAKLKGLADDLKLDYIGVRATIEF